MVPMVILLLAGFRKNAKGFRECVAYSCKNIGEIRENAGGFCKN